MQCGIPSESDGPAPRPWWKSGSGLVMCGFLVVAAFYLITEHTAHLYGVLPFLLLLSCPLMHFFHHRGLRKPGPQPLLDAVPAAAGGARHDP